MATPTSIVAWRIPWTEKPGGPQSMRSQSRIGLSDQQLCCAKSLQSCPTLCAFVDGSLPGSCVHGILQARTLEWVAVPSSRGSSQPMDRTRVSHSADRLFKNEPPGKPCKHIWIHIKGSNLRLLHCRRILYR